MKKTILVVDDKAANRAALCEMFMKKYTMIEASNGMEALEIVKEKYDEISMILLDVKMPKMNGFDVMRELKNNGYINKIPVIMITAMEHGDFEKIGYNLGVSDYIVKPFDPDTVIKRVENVIKMFVHMNSLEQKVERQHQKLVKQSDVLKQYTDKMTDILCTLVEYRSLEATNNISRVKSLTRLIAEYVKDMYPQYNITPEYVEALVRASSLHDIGKIIIPDAILLKPGKLTETEFEIMKSHTTKGAEIILYTDMFEDKFVENIVHEVCRGHHERYDGTGYPDGLKGDEIPISAQIVGIADVYDALISDRIYKKACTPDKAYSMIISGECGVFSPMIISSLRNLKEEFEKYI